MIFIIFFGLIAVAIIALNVVNSNNIDDIENYYAAQRCDAVSTVRGVYKGACANSIILINNGFSIDLSKPTKEILYKDIQGIKKQDKMLTLMTNEMVELEFKDNNQLEEFYKKVQSKK